MSARAQPLLAAAERYVAAFSSIKDGLPGTKLDWLAAAREAGLELFAEQGFPSPRSEAWKYTNLAALARAGLTEPADAPDLSPDALAPHLIAEAEAHLAVFVGGRLAPSLSRLDELPAGAEVTPLARALADAPEVVRPSIEAVAADRRHPLGGLNTAFLRDGLVVRLAPGTALARPLHFVHVGAPPVAHPYILVVAEAGSEATLIETYHGASEDAYWTNAVTDLSVGENASLRHVRLQAESDGAYHTALVRLHLARDAAYRGHFVGLGALLSRIDVAVAIEGPGADCTLEGVTLLEGGQHGDITTDVDHTVPRGESRQHFRAVVDGKARSVYQGRIAVAAGAQKTNAFQMSRNLLLSAEAEADAKPELRIFADDVKCSHGATVGELDADQLFYLTSRGIDEAAARALLVEAFVGELLDAIAPEPVQAHLRRLVAQRLAGKAAR